MVNDQLLNYIKQQLALSVTKDVIITNLKSQGWNEIDISEAFAALSMQNISSGNMVPLNVIQNQQVGQTTTQTNINQISPELLPKHSLKNKKWILIVVGFILLCLLGGGAYAYYSGAFLSLPQLTSKAIDNVRKTNSATYDTTISIDFSELKEVTGGINQMLAGSIAPTKISLTAGGSYDFSDINNKKMLSKVSVDGGLFSTILDLRVVDNTFFGELVKAPTLSFLPVLAKFEGKWFSFPLKSEDTQSLNNSFNPINSIIGVDSKVIDKITPEQKEHLYQITRDANFIKTVKKFPAETISGEPSYHFIFDFDREGINKYFVTLKEYVNTIGKDDSTLSSFDPTSFSKFLDNIQDFKGEVWIGRKDTLPYKIMLDFSVKPDEKKDEKVKISIVSIFSAWNKPVSIIAPTESTPFEEFISSVMSDSLGQAKEKSMDASIKANLANTRPEAESFYNSKKVNSYSGFCLSSALKNSRKEIEKVGGTEFVCKDEKNKYAVGVKLITDSSYFCVDSTGFAGVIKSKLASTACPKQ